MCTGAAAQWGGIEWGVASMRATHSGYHGEQRGASDPIWFARQGIEEALQAAPRQLDAMCCMSGIGMIFTSKETSSRLLQSIVNRVKPGGFFFGFCLDSAGVVRYGWLPLFDTCLPASAVWGKCTGDKGEFRPQPVKHRKGLYQLTIKSIHGAGFHQYGTRADLRFQALTLP